VLFIGTVKDQLSVTSTIEEKADSVHHSGFMTLNDSVSLDD
jgi:hypothetical protein